MFARAARSAVPRSRYWPARTALITSTIWPAPWASARMSTASLIARPVKPRSSRRTSVMRVRDSVAGSAGSPVNSGSAKWPDITRRAPAAIAARNGTSSRSAMADRERATTASS